VTGGFIVFTLLFVVACRIAVLQLFRGIESSRASALSSVWDVSSMWTDGSFSCATQMETGKWISRDAELRIHSADQSAMHVATNAADE
jgi:hypothetical protein